MKTSSNSPRRSLFTAVLAIAGCLSLSAMTASADNYNFNNGAGGDGTWENGAGGTPWSDGGTQNLPWDNTLNNTAVFEGSGGTVDVASDVTAGYMQFNAGSNVTLDGTGTITVATGNGVFEDDTNNNVTIDNNIQLDDSIPSDRFDIGDGGANTLTLNGNISYIGSNVQASGQALIFNGGANTNFVLNGSFQGSATVPGRLILSGGTMYLNGTYTNANSSNLLEVDSGTVYLGSSTLGTGSINLGGGDATTPVLLTKGTQTITNTVYATNYTFGPPDFESGAVVIGGSTADLSTYDSIQSVVTGITLTAAANGRVDIGNIGNSVPTGLIKVGAGTVDLLNANTYSINNYDIPPGTVAADIQQGTVLINNPTDTSAFGNNSGEVKVEAGATLGGNGSTGGSQKVMALSTALSNAVIAPGDAGQANLGIHASMGTLSLAGGLEADNGLTMDFKLNGAGQSDHITTAGLTLGGQIIINLTAMGSTPLLTGTPYQLIDGSGIWTSAPDFTVNAPTGYTATFQYRPATFSLTVELEATPEPSTYAMMLGGLALLGFCIRRKGTLLS
jgi:fibronectin-binding autotransporter adhesin